LPLCCFLQPDGNCLYRALEDQLQGEQGAEKDMPTGHEALRAAAADYMRSHEKEFAPFVLPVSVLKRARASSWTEGKTRACMGCPYRISNTRRICSKCTYLYECRKRPRARAESRTRTSSSTATATRWRRRRCGAAR